MSMFTRTERIEVRRGQIVRIVTAHPYGKKHYRPIDVVQETADESHEDDNVNNCKSSSLGIFDEF